MLENAIDSLPKQQCSLASETFKDTASMSGDKLRGHGWNAERKRNLEILSSMFASSDKD